MRSKLLDVCKTRWLRRIDGLEGVHEMMEPILQTLDMISCNHDDSYNKDARSDAQGVYWTFRSFQFLVHLVIVRYVMSYTLPLTYELQAEKIDVVKVYKAVDNVLESLKECRKEFDLKHADRFNEATEFTAQFDVLPSVKRITGQQTLRSNYVINNPAEYYKLSLMIPLLDRVISELETRFSKEHRVHGNGFYILPATAIKDDDDLKSHVCEFAKEYERDLPEPMNMKTELDQWEVFWKQNFRRTQNVPDTIVTTLQSVNTVKHWFPNIYTILCLIAVVPTSSNSCERSISRLRLLKTYLRSMMKQDRLTSLALIYIHREIELEPEKVVDEFAKNHQHRMKFVDILKDD